MNWPCDRRDAHGPHTTRRWVASPYGVGPPHQIEKPCPGVKAHPATMIGRNG